MTTNNVSNPHEECECKKIADQVKQDIENWKAWIVMEMEARPLLVRKIAEIVSVRVENLICGPIQDIATLCNNHGYDAILPPNERGCKATAHHCLC